MIRWLAPAPVLTICSLSLYWAAVAWYDNATLKSREHPPAVVVNAPLQVLLYGGDRFLAANIESIRAAASATAMDAQNFRLRAHIESSRLNPCHEDNYWIGNASLSWGGAPEEGFGLLRHAAQCRYWDEWPPFFYGFNQYFFLHNIPQAQHAIEVAEHRSSKNAAMFHTFAIMLKMGEIDDTRMALKMIESERDKAREPALREMLDKRVMRLSGLLTLRDAQATYEKRFHRPLLQPGELLTSGILAAFPQDPLKVGYEFRDNTFHLRQMNPQ